jgi:ergothioneine biosynthesis protein EgtB
MSIQELKDLFLETRTQTESICKPLEIEDYVVQPIVDVSPPKWHLGHTSWFFEEFVLKTYSKEYKLFHDEFAFVFNSYYESVGKRVVRTNRGNLSRPTVSQVYNYRHYVTKKLQEFIENGINDDIISVIEIGIHHEKQHQELLLTDIKYILGHNPLFPKYKTDFVETKAQNTEHKWITIPEGTYNIGHKDTSFCYDNELGVHKVYLHEFKVSNILVTNREYLEFINNKGYQQPLLWHSEAWDWLKNHNVESPMYWYKINDKWMKYGLGGLEELKLDLPVSHISYFEAFAFAQWKGCRLPTEFEWEVAQPQLSWGQLWEWTESAYLPYPDYKKADGALGEYNGKFMVNQKVLRGKSIATPIKHARPTYRNFFHPQLRWQFNGIRLAQ